MVSWFWRFCLNGATSSWLDEWVFLTQVCGSAGWQQLYFLTVPTVCAEIDHLFLQILCRWTGDKTASSAALLPHEAARFSQSDVEKYTLTEPKTRAGQIIKQKIKQTSWSTRSCSSIISGAKYFWCHSNTVTAVFIYLLLVALPLFAHLRGS